MVTTRLLENRSVLIMISVLSLQSCTNTKKPSDDVTRPSEKTVVNVLVMPEQSVFNAYEYRPASSWKGSMAKRYPDFLLREDTLSNNIYLHRKMSPGFMGIEKAVRSDSSFLVKEFSSSMLLLALPAPFNAFYTDFVAVAFWGAGHGVLYSSFLSDSVVTRDSLSMDAVESITSVMRMRPRSQDEISSGGGYLVFVSSITNGSPQSFIVRRGLPYHIMSREDFPGISDERFTMLSMTDSMIWMIAQIADPDIQLQPRAERMRSRIPMSPAGKIQAPSADVL